MIFRMEGSYGKAQGSPHIVATLVAALYAKEIAQSFRIPIDKTMTFEKCLRELIENHKSPMALYVQKNLPVYIISTALIKSKLALNGLVPAGSVYSTIIITITR